MKLVKSFLLAGVFVASSFGASFSVSVGFPSAPTSPGCTVSRADGLTDFCSAVKNASYGSSLLSSYGNASTYVAVFGTLSTTQPAGSSVTVKSSYTATITDFAGLSSGGVTVASDYTIDGEIIDVYDNTNTVIGTLYGGDSLNIPYNKASNIQLYAIHTTSGTEDYTSDAHLTLTKY
jgi:hypothetical protein